MFSFLYVSPSLLLIPCSMIFISAVVLFIPDWVFLCFLVPCWNDQCLDNFFSLIQLTFLLSMFWILIWWIFCFSIFFFNGLLWPFQLRGLPWWCRGSSICPQCERPGFNPWVRKILWRRNWQPTPVLLPWKSHGQRSLVGYKSMGLQGVGQDWVTSLHFQLRVVPLPFNFS